MKTLGEKLASFEGFEVRTIGCLPAERFGVCCDVHREDLANAIDYAQAGLRGKLRAARESRDGAMKDRRDLEAKLAEAEKKSDSDYIDICMLPDCKHREDGDGLGRMSRRGCRIGDHPRRKAHELVEELEAKLAEAVKECEHLRRVREPLRRIAALEAMLRRLRSNFYFCPVCGRRMWADETCEPDCELAALLPEEG